MLEEVDRAIIRAQLYLGDDEMSQINRANARRHERLRAAADQLRAEVLEEAGSRTGGTSPAAAGGTRPRPGLPSLGIGARGRVWRRLARGGSPEVPGPGRVAAEPGEPADALPEPPPMEEREPGGGE